MSRTWKGKMLAETANPADLGSRTAWWLRSAGYSAKEVARVVGQSEGIGKRLRQGVPPTTEQFTKLARHFGWRFVSFVMEAVIGQPRRRYTAASVAKDLPGAARLFTVLPDGRWAPSPEFFSLTGHREA